MIGKLFLTVSIKHLLNVLTETNETGEKRKKKNNQKDVSNLLDLLFHKCIPHCTSVC